nr:MAG TPA: alkyl hydroperoxide reductase subunit [Caudoviricetes sp.]
MAAQTNGIGALRVSALGGCPFCIQKMKWR